MSARTPTAASCLPRLRLPLALACLLMVAACVLSFPAHAVGTRHFVTDTGKAFLQGKLEGVAVDSSGQLRSGFDLGRQELPGADTSWDALMVGDALLVATGNEGKLLRVTAGKVDEVAALKALALTCLVQAWGRVVVGAMPGGQLYELKGNELLPFATLEGAGHVWGLAFDVNKQALFAATGPDGKLYRVLSDGTAQVYFDSDQPHLVSVAMGPNGPLAGSSGKARLYQVAGPGRASVLYDFGLTEVRAIEVAKDGTVFAIASELKEESRGTIGKAARTAGPRRATPKKGKGVLYRFSPSGLPERLYDSPDDHLVALALDDHEDPVIGTGGEGRVLHVGGDHESTVLADLDERQISRLVLTRGKGWVVASDPVVVHAVRGLGGADAVWTSKVFDAGLRARFGRMDWDAEGKVTLSTRSGDTSEPDETWSDWSPELSAASAVASPPGRYLQVRARLNGGQQSRVRRIDVPFVTDNLRPVVTAVEVKSAAASTSSAEGPEKSGGPLDGTPKSTIEVSWKVDNPDEDELRYFVEYRLTGRGDWYDALEPGKVLTRREFSWQTEDLPEGRYVLRVTATDELSNPPAQVLRHSYESPVVLVDNTAPRIDNVEVRGSVITGQVADLLGPVRRLEVRFAGREEWIPFAPDDGIFDQAREAFSVDLTGSGALGTELVTLRAFDTAGNATVLHVRLGAVSEKMP